MLALQLDNTAVKTFMGQILREDIFDMFEVRSIDIAVATRINIDGQLEAGPQEDDSEGKKPGFATWGALRPLVLGIIKTSPKPGYMKIVFSYPAVGACEIHANAAALFLNMAYENDTVTFTTGASQREFALDKTLDANWDEWVRGFFTKAGLQVSDRS